jgi:hypothetical protein
MPIYNKDGSVFKLQGVNPLMKEQDHWDEKWEVHNPQTEDVIVLPDPKRNPASNAPIMVGVGTLPQTDILYCLPLIQITEEDPLYGQQSIKTDWGEKFSFEAIQISATGLTASFYATLSADRVPQGSIIYVYKERQWWKVNGVEAAEGGVNIHCMPTDLKPSFV